LTAIVLVSGFGIPAPDQEVLNARRSRYQQRASYSSGVRGRSIANVHSHHFVIDEPWIAEAQTPAETFPAGVSACAVGLIEHVAGERGTIVSHSDVKIEGFREQANPSYFQKVEMTFQLDGVDDAAARDLVVSYQSY
jgi:uncharacterized OsmC-like protein